jgi:YidC/Oxa1 family membrane protein insertase
MEKRFFLAIFLSMVTIFLFQILFGTQRSNKPHDLTEPVGVQQFIENKNIVQSDHDHKNQADLEVPLINEETAVIEDGVIRVETSNKGGRILGIHLIDENYDLVVDGHLDYGSYSDKKFEFIRISGTDIKYILYAGDLEIEKAYSIDKNHQILATLKIRNTSSSLKEVSKYLNVFNINHNGQKDSSRQADWTLFEYSINRGKNIFRKESAFNFNEKWNREEVADTRWFGYRDRYFVTISRPLFSVEKYAVKTVSDKILSLAVVLPDINLEPQEEVSFPFAIFSGKQLISTLKTAGDGYEKIMVFSNWGWLDAIAKAIYWLLGMIHGFVPSWGLSIIIISLVIYGLMYPLTIQSLVSMKRMQTLQPKIKELQKKYEKTPEKLNKEIMQLYKDNRVNPLSGCLPMLLQMPIFIGLYQVLWRSVYFRGEGFLWIQDLSMPDKLFKFPVLIPIVGEYFNILPLVMVAVMAVQQKLSMQSMASGDSEQAKQQKLMAVIFPILIGFIFYNFASGLNLYFVVFYILSALAQWKISLSTVKA